MSGSFLITLVELEERPVLRITSNNETKDYWLTDDQAKLLLRQLANHLTK